MNCHIQQANVLGIPVAAVNMASALEVIQSGLRSSEKSYVCLAGAHGIMEARRDPALAKIFAEALLTLPDGMPTVWIGRDQGFQEMDRVFGPDLMLALFGQSQHTGCTHFLYGSRPGVAEELRSRLHMRFPRAQVVGTYTPPFRDLNPAEEQDLIATLDRLKPSIVWVGISTPKQERFMASYLPRLQTRMMIGVGAAFDYHTGRINDSPRWVKRSGLQWAHRLLQDPGRLWKRYLRTNPGFFVMASCQLLRLRRFRFDPPAITQAP